MKKFLIILVFFTYLILFSLLSLTFKSKWEGNVVLFMKNVSNELTIDALMGNVRNEKYKNYQKCFYNYSSTDIFLVLKRLEENNNDNRNKVNLYLGEKSNIVTINYESNNKKETLNTLNNAKNDYLNYFKEISNNCITKKLKPENINALNLDDNNSLVPISVISEPKIIKVREPKIITPGIINLFTTLIITCIGILIKEKSTERIYSKEEFKELIPFEFLGNIYENMADYNFIFLKKLVDNHQNPIRSTFSFKAINDRKTKNKNKLKSIFANNEINELLSLKQSDINDCGGIFLVLEEGCINKRNLKMVCNICGLNNQKIIGWIFLEKKDKTLIF